MIEKFLNSINNWLDSLANIILAIKNTIVDMGSYAFSILKTIRYGLTTITSSLWSILQDIVGNGALNSLNNTITSLSDYIGGTATWLICSMFLIVVVRILIAFVFKLLRLNIDYHSLNSKNKRWNIEDSKKSFS